MRSFLKFLLPVLAVWMLGINSAYAQLTSWRYSTTIDITENRGVAYTQYPILVYINTATLIASGQMQANGADMRFAQNCSGSQLLPYYIESGINTDSTKVWIRLPQVNGFNVTTVYFFSGNASATSAANFGLVFPNAFIASSNNTLGGAQNYDWFEVPAGDTVFAFAGSPLTINASRIIVAGVIDANGAGNTGGATFTDGNGPGAGTHSSALNSGAGGGSYGGVGGTGGYDPGDAPGAGGPAYGTANGNDIDMGSGGAGGGDVTGANGGGEVVLNAFDITITGGVFAEGDDAAQTALTGGGGGSGGGLEAIGEHLAITGTVSAAGGDGSMMTISANDGGGGGSGGRIKAFYYANATLATIPNVNGGAGGTGGTAASGTPGDPGTVSGQQLYGAFGITVHPLSLSHTSTIASGTDSACVNSTNTYTAATSGAVSYMWRAVGGTVVSGQGTNTVNIQFTVAGTDSVILVTTNGTGCPDSVKQAVLVNGTTPVAQFNHGGACTGLITQFTDASTGTVAAYNWSFGDGGTSTDRNPVHTYASAGTYNVTLTVSSAFGCSNSVIKVVRVDNSPVAAFSGTDACLNTPNTFTNSTTGAATYLWNYGDGVTSGVATPTSTHQYGAAGTYTVTLLATSTNGCADSTSQQVSVFPNPTPSFTATDVCDGNPVQFTNATTIASGLFSSLWKFGDGATSTDNNPAHTYATPALYAATLITTSDNGCKDSVSHLVHVNSNPVASFTQSAASICLGDSVTFVATTSVGSISYAWTFGDGATSTIPTTTHTYTTPGTYTVTLTVFDSTGGCSSTKSGSVTVFPHPTASFVASTACQGNTSQFTNTSTVSPGTFSNSWSFGDGSTSTDINPSHTYAAAGTYTVKLTITTNNGCMDTISHLVAVNQQPVAKFGEVDNSVCNGVTVQFVDSSTVSGTTGYHWYFGDGDSSNAVSPSHTYAGPGSYTVILNLIDSVTGCSASYTSKVDVFARPAAAFSGTDVCLHNATQFTNTSTISNGSITGNLWFFGDTTTSTDINPAHTYAFIGIKTVALVVTSDNGCSDTIQHTVVVNPLPVADFSPTTACFGQAVNFTNLTTIAFGTTTYAWDFGDGTTDNTTSPSHTFPALGSYTVKLTAISNFGCTNTISKTVTIEPNPSANFIVNNTCKGDSVHLVNLSAVSPGTITSFWEFGDGNTSVSSNPSYSYTAAGTYNITLVVTSNHGCMDSTTRAVTIYPTPFANFISNDVCIGEKTVFQSISTVTGGFISDVKWDFGDGDASVSNSPIHEYANPGNYVVKLTVTSNQGCRDSVTKAVVVHPLPDPTIRALGPVAFCLGDSVELSAGITGTDIYHWSTSATTQNIIVKQSGLYSVTVTSQFGCKDSDAISITAWTLPIANAGNDTIISKGYLAHLHGSGGVIYLWSPADSTIDNINAQNPNVRPLTTTTYTLLVTDSNGCKGTDSVIVNVLEDFLVEANNVITPNGDGHNDLWTIVNIQTYPQCEVLIFDRLGNKVFESKAYHNEWDGKYKGRDLPEGTYYYVIKFDGNDRLYKGAVSILR